MSPLVSGQPLDLLGLRGRRQAAGERCKSQSRKLWQWMLLLNVGRLMTKVGPIR